MKAQYRTFLPDRCHHLASVESGTLVSRPDNNRRQGIAGNSRGRFRQEPGFYGPLINRDLVDHLIVDLHCWCNLDVGHDKIYSSSVLVDF